MKPVRVLFVCLGNICRSPTAEGVFRHQVAEAGLADRIETDSAGTAAYHIGKSPDPRSQEEAARRGIRIDDLRARRVSEEDFIEFDYVLAMDAQNLRDLEALYEQGGRQGRPPELFLRYAPEGLRNEVPDPYYGGPEGFRHVFDLCRDAANGLLAHIQQQELGKNA
ncbi:MAG: low molecular weight phosphotyrosine protein phosphatase [Natronospirillum sp.]|uniref:low molecular weight protein-tyrosine-phosphatase n=1 Tax=Natronospirillum sp. TaxID=2812955 RepID=UPI0025F07727|nr:low molecular weight protein-tyrosine-phosphatase [Natronospirillum sp.]MCH8553307.1 low molecular weight phosphotyrosine protein phosphatase [Natronospirillum sp.]